MLLLGQPDRHPTSKTLCSRPPLYARLKATPHGIARVTSTITIIVSAHVQFCSDEYHSAVALCKFITLKTVMHRSFGAQHVAERSQPSANLRSELPDCVFPPWQRCDSCSRPIQITEMLIGSRLWDRIPSRGPLWGCDVDKLFGTFDANSRWRAKCWRAARRFLPC